jgi:hypothetical protein
MFEYLKLATLLFPQLPERFAKRHLAFGRGGGDEENELSGTSRQFFFFFLSSNTHRSLM